ncbi:uncharacterized protein cubi_02024 [Cryptosporidium ubiquitum]|uniref:START domain-containing protein n=1 Tax=Cryptosporidium ubiquitum TaxID=857276 RepID=A0A1J4MN84_9CRYT|nr:uncharacterized protein cubi_02024 [Cryptosporidium ubiquitum]OII75503.1 hypothetical protein cubi_02024 [Cryptosporidium ubiquitum]
MGKLEENLEKAILLYKDERVWEYGFICVYNQNPLILEIQRRAACIKYFANSFNDLNINRVEINSDFYNKKYEDFFHEFKLNILQSEVKEEFYSENDTESNNSFKSLNSQFESLNNVDELEIKSDCYFDDKGNLFDDKEYEECTGLITKTKPREWQYIIQKNPFDLWYRSYENSSIIEICFQGFIKTNIFNVLSVFYERDLYKDWIPYYTFPIKFGLNSIKEILHKDRIHLVTAIYIDIPWPFANREIILEIWVSNEIIPNNRIFIHASSIENHGYHPRLKVEIPYSLGYSNRAKISGGGFVSPHGDDLTHLIFKWKIDLLFEPPKVLLNFFLRNFIKACWDKFNNVCIHVDEPNSLHKERLTTNKDLYDFIRTKINERNRIELKNTNDSAFN